MTKQEVEFPSENPVEIIRADLYLPEGEGPWPVAVMGGGWCYVKELAMPEYAKFIVEQGVAALIFDFRCLGTSDGEPRQHLDPWMQISDYRSAIDAISYLDEFKGVLDKIMKNQRSRNFWKLKLRKETKEYVPKFLAMLKVGRERYPDLFFKGAPRYWVASR